MNFLSKEAILVIVVVIIPFSFLLRGVIMKRARRIKKLSNALTDEEIEKIRRMNNLFDDLPPENGREWWTLEVQELKDICVNAAWGIHKVGVHSMKDILIYIAERCEELSQWMSKNASDPFYARSDMSSMIDKPSEVGRFLRETALKVETSNA
jgi:hypothetical protein